MHLSNFLCSISCFENIPATREIKDHCLTFTISHNSKNTLEKSYFAWKTSEYILASIIILGDYSLIRKTRAKQKPHSSHARNALTGHEHNKLCLTWFQSAQVKSLLLLKLPQLFLILYAIVTSEEVE